MNEPAPTAKAIRRGPLRVSVTVFDHRGKAWRLARTPWKEARTRTRGREDFPDAKDIIRYLAIAVIAVATFWFAWWQFSIAFLPSMRKDGVFVFVLASVAAPLAIGVLQTFVIYKAARWLWAPIEAREMLRKNLCPHCRFSLAAIIPEPDGCTVCPECGAAWKLPPPPPNNPT